MRQFNKRNFIFLFIASLSSVAILPLGAAAVCPVCTVAVGAGVGFSRWLGIDDLISGAWLGGLIVSCIIWFLAWLDKKQIYFKLRGIVIIILFYLLFLAPLYWSDIIGGPFNKFCGLDKIVFGVIVGSFTFLLAVWLNNFLKKRNQGKALFPFQKVVLPLAFLIITTAVIYLIIVC